MSTPTKFQVTVDDINIHSGNNFMVAQCTFSAAVKSAPDKTVRFFHNGTVRSMHTGRQ